MILKDKVVIVTGSSRGIGLAIAETYAKEGAKIVICSTTQEKSDSVSKKISGDYKIETLGIQVDVSNEDSVKNLVDKTLEKFERIDILVNNAGITKDNLLIRLSFEDWKRVIDTNLNSVFLCTKAVLRTMLKQKGGRIINMSSGVGVIGNAGQANYSASKAGLIGFTKTVAKEYGAKGILCNAIAPGFIETDMIISLPKDYLDNIISTVPMKRLGTSKEVANMALFLASDLASYITGQVLHVDGGLVMN